MRFNFQQCQIFMNNMSNCSIWLAHYENIYFYVIWTVNWHIIMCFLDLGRDCSRKSTHVRDLIFSSIQLSMSRFQYHFVFGCYKNSQNLNAHISFRICDIMSHVSKQVLWGLWYMYMSTFSTTVFNLVFCNVMIMSLTITNIAMI